MKILIILLLIEFSLFSFVVTIDPGHGGPFEGAHGVTDLVLEKDATLDVALRLAKLLTADGIDVRLTRTSDIALREDLGNDLLARKKVAEGSDAFVSIHFNQCGNKKKMGFEVYVPYQDPIPVKSYQFAGCVHSKLGWCIEPNWHGNLGNLNLIDGGIRAARFNVLMNNPAPATILVELDYISNPFVEKQVSNPTYRQKLAECLREGILQYRDQTKP